MTPLHQAALAYAARGVPVFPINPGMKTPAYTGSFKDATTDPAVINAWWALADYNIGTEPAASGMTVVDVDNKNGHNGNQSWHDLCEANGGPLETLVVKSPNWGMHYYFAGTLPPSVGKLGDGLDIRSIGSYVLLSPSVVDGRAYEVVTPGLPAPLPAWISDKLAKRRHEPAAAPEGVEEDPEDIEEWAITLIEAVIEHDGPAVVTQGVHQPIRGGVDRQPELSRQPPFPVPRSRPRVSHTH